jgi:ABC-2 type transport system ATP-binding protein
VRDLSFSFKNFNISNVSFCLKNGDVMGLIGRSGSGKSTLIKTILGLKRPDSGYVKFFVDDKEMDIKPFVGFSPQHNSLYPLLTVKENIVIFGRLYNMKYSDIKNNMNFLLEKLEIKDVADKKIFQLSGGMQKRVDIAVALIHSPLIIVLDEPFTGLDISLQNFIWDFLLELKDEGRIIIVSSHLIRDLQFYCTKVGLLENGVFYGTEEILQSMKSSKIYDLESFLKVIFDRDYKLR